VVKLDFVGGSVRPKGLDSKDATINYFKGKPGEWRTGLRTYGRLVYEDLWPGIDLVYSGTQERLKYEFMVHPGADPVCIPGCRSESNGWGEASCGDASSFISGREALCVSGS
jgi:hypothetical protein